MPEMLPKVINGIPVSPWMYEMAMNISMNPGIACFDDMNLYSKGKWLDQGEMEVDDYDSDNVCRAEVFQIILLEPKDQRVARSVFRYPRACEVASERLIGEVLPSPFLILVPEFPLTRDIVLGAVRRHIRQRTEYGSDNDRFLWGPEVVILEP